MAKESDFNFEEFEKDAIDKLKSGKPLSGKDGTFITNNYSFPNRPKYTDS